MAAVAEPHNPCWMNHSSGREEPRLCGYPASMTENDETLAALRRPADAQPALEDDPVVAEAAYLDEAAVPGLTPPGGAGPQEDGLTPAFQAPDPEEP